MNLINGLYPEVCSLYIWAPHGTAQSEDIFCLSSGISIIQYPGRDLVTKY